MREKVKSGKMDSASVSCRMETMSVSLYGLQPYNELAAEKVRAENRCGAMRSKKQKTMSRKDKTLDSNVEISGENLAGFVGEDTDLDDLEILGFATVSTVGGEDSMLVPREWLIPRMEELDLPEFMQPNEPRPSSAFKRAIKNRWMFESEVKQVNDHKVKFSLNSGEGNTVHVMADVYISAEQIAEQNNIPEEEAEGEWRTVTLGLVKYDEGHMMTVDKVEDEHPLAEEWESLKERAHDLFEKMQTHHIGYDFQIITYHLRKHWTDSVPLRDGGSVAFIPNTPEVANTLQGLNTLFEEIDQEYKTSGKHIEMNTIPMLNTDSQRALVERRAKEQVEETAGKMVDAARESIREDMPIEDIAEEISSELAEADDFAGRYNSLLDAELSAERLIEEWMTDFDQDLRDALTEAGIGVEPQEAAAESPDEDESESEESGDIEEVGGGWYLVKKADGEEEKVQGREAAEEAAAE